MKKLILTVSAVVVLLLTSCDQTGPGCYKYSISQKGVTITSYQYWDETAQHDIFVSSLKSQGLTVDSYSKVNKNRSECASSNIDY